MTTYSLVGEIELGTTPEWKLSDQVWGHVGEPHLIPFGLARWPNRRHLDSILRDVDMATDPCAKLYCIMICHPRSLVNFWSIAGVLFGALRWATPSPKCEFIPLFLFLYLTPQFILTRVSKCLSS